jgi:hypothetical protein
MIIAANDPWIVIDGCEIKSSVSQRTVRHNRIKNVFIGDKFCLLLKIIKTNLFIKCNLDVEFNKWHMVMKT